MANFPVLKTGVVAQYPLEQVAAFASQEVRFLDGSRQTYALRPKSLRRWRLRFDLLDDSEAAVISQFAETYGTTTFSFIDPATAAAVPRCRFATEGVAIQVNAEGKTAMDILIEEMP